jgi:hypothetical protein
VHHGRGHRAVEAGEGVGPSGEFQEVIERENLRPVRPRTGGTARSGIAISPACSHRSPNQAGSLMSRRTCTITSPALSAARPPRSRDGSRRCSRAMARRTSLTSPLCEQTDSRCPTRTHQHRAALPSPSSPDAATGWPATQISSALFGATTTPTTWRSAMPATISPSNNLVSSKPPRFRGSANVSERPPDHRSGYACTLTRRRLRSGS